VPPRPNRHREASRNFSGQAVALAPARSQAPVAPHRPIDFRPLLFVSSSFFPPSSFFSPPPPPLSPPRLFQHAAPGFVPRAVIVAAIVSRRGRVYAYKSFLLASTPADQAETQFFSPLPSSPAREEGEAEGERIVGWMGTVCCALSLSLSLSVLGWKVDRIPEEIEWKSRRARRCNSEVT